MQPQQSEIRTSAERYHVRLNLYLELGDPFVCFDEVPDFCSNSFEVDLQQILSRLEAARVTEIVTVDLTRPSIGIPVVRVIVPGLEGMNDFCTCKPGPRARALLQARAAA